MFVIYSGSVKVHDGDLTFAMLKSRDFFGELSLLDTEPRSASVTALENSLLLRIDQQAFYEIMSDRSEVIREIMKILCRRFSFAVVRAAGARAAKRRHAGEGPACPRTGRTRWLSALKRL
jgi:CRP-like cAMP-binding protein